MNQILISEKIYVTPELKRKKKLYKFNFVVSIILVVVLFGYYVYAEYDRNSADKSQEILSGLKVVDQSVDTTIADSTIKLNDDILVVVLDEKLDNEPQEEINLDKLIEANKNAGSKIDTKSSRNTIYSGEIKKMKKFWNFFAFLVDNRE